MSSLGLHVTQTPRRVQARGKAINGSTGAKTKWNSAPSRMHPPRTFNSSSAFSRISRTNEHVKQCSHGWTQADLKAAEVLWLVYIPKKDNKGWRQKSGGRKV